jgi:hypothetical protein
MLNTMIKRITIIMNYLLTYFGLHIVAATLLLSSASYAAPATIMNSMTTAETSLTLESLTQPIEFKLAHYAPSLALQNGDALVEYYSVIGSHVMVMDTLANVVGAGQSLTHYTLMNSNLWTAWSTSDSASLWRDNFLSGKGHFSALVLIFAPVFMSILIVRRRLK